jgi:hypothetical protein
MHPKTFPKLLLLFASLLSAHLLSAQCLPAHSAYLDANHVKALMLNGGDQWWNLIGQPRYQVPVNGPGSAYLHSSFSAALWIGGIDPSGNLHMTANTYRQSGVDYYTGPVRDGFAYDCGATIESVNNILSGTFTRLAGGEMILPHGNGFTLYDEASGTTTEIPFGGISAASQCLQLQDGRVMAICGLTSLVPDVVVIMDTLTFTPSVACTLAANYLNPCLTLLSTGEVMMSSLGTEIFDPATLTSTLIPGAPICMRAKSILYPSDSVLLIGGSLGAANRWYDHSTGTFTLGPASLQSFPDAALAQLPDGTYLLAGGSDTIGTNLYDPVSRTFVPGPNLTEGLGLNHAIALPSGDVLIASAGGMELYDYSSNSFSRLGQLNFKGGLGLLPTGKVLLQLDGTVCGIYDPFTDQLEGHRFQHLWNLTRAEIDSFIADYAAGTVDYSKYPDIESWPAHGNVALGESRNLAPFADLNGSGTYDPALGEYPCVTGDQSLWYVVNDDGPHGGTGSANAMGIEVEMTSYGFNTGTTTCTDSFVDYSTFYHCEITNRSGIDYHDVYVGLWVDGDLGNYGDDFIGCDTTRNLGFIYNGDANDETSAGYGLNPPAFGVKLLKTPGNLGMTNFMYYEGDFSMMGNPEEVTDYYGLMKSEFKDSSHLVDNGLNGYPGSGAGPNTNYIFPGDGGWCGGAASGWSEVSAGRTPTDRRMIISCGPLDLAADSTVKLDYAAIWARTVSGGNLASVCELQAATDAITNWWSSQDFDCFNLTVRNEAAQAALPALTLFPNPNSGSFTLRWAKPLVADQSVSIRDASGREVARREVTRGTREVQLAEPLASGIYLVLCGDGTAVKMVVQ